MVVTSAIRLKSDVERGKAAYNCQTSTTSTVNTPYSLPREDLNGVKLGCDDIMNIKYADVTDVAVVSRLLLRGEWNIIKNRKGKIDVNRVQPKQISLFKYV